MQKIIILIHRESKRQESKTDGKIYKKIIIMLLFQFTHHRQMRKKLYRQIFNIIHFDDPLQLMYEDIAKARLFAASAIDPK